MDKYNYNPPAVYKMYKNHDIYDSFDTYYHYKSINRKCKHLIHKKNNHIKMSSYDPHLASIFTFYNNDYVFEGEYLNIKYD